MRKLNRVPRESHTDRAISSLCRRNEESDGSVELWQTGRVSRLYVVAPNAYVLSARGGGRIYCGSDA